MKDILKEKIILAMNKIDINSICYDLIYLAYNREEERSRLETHASDTALCVTRYEKLIRILLKRNFFILSAPIYLFLIVKKITLKSARKLYRYILNKA